MIFLFFIIILIPAKTAPALATAPANGHRDPHAAQFVQKVETFLKTKKPEIYSSYHTLPPVEQFSFLQDALRPHNQKRIEKRLPSISEVNVYHQVLSKER